MARRSDIDWDSIEVQYRLGQKTNKQLAAEFKVEGSTIGRRAEKYGWVQDKSAEVHTRANNLILRAVVDERTGKNANGNANVNATPTDADIKVAAQIEADKVLEHRHGLRKLTGLKDKLVLRLENAIDGKDMLDEIIALSSMPDEKGHDRRTDLLNKIMDMPALANTLKTLAEVDEKIRKGEREAFGMSLEPTNPGGEIAEFIKSISRAGSSFPVAPEPAPAAQTQEA
jgi:hypothetical protein